MLCVCVMNLRRMLLVYIVQALHLSLTGAHEEHKSNDSKTSRMGMTWWDGDPWIPEPMPPAPLGPQPPTVRPPQPPAPFQPQPPAPFQPQPPAPFQPQPPAPLQPQPPAPLPDYGNSNGRDTNRGSVYAEEIHCVRSDGITLLSAVVIPPPEYTVMPVFEDAVTPNQPSADCAMRPNLESHGGSIRPSSFAMQVQHFSKCGVRVQQGSDGKEWVSVTLRFPYMAGLRMAEDEYVMIMCKPHEKTASANYLLDVRSTSTEGRAIQKKKIFRSGPRDMACKMSLLAKSPGSQTFNNEMKSGTLLRLGQELQFRGVVRDGDGWRFAALRDVVITRVQKQSSAGAPRGIDTQRLIHPQLLQEIQREHQTFLETITNNVDIGENYIYNDKRKPSFGIDSAYLVFSDGCRNSIYRPVAPYHPSRDPNNPLVITFNFKTFMFQDMLDGESLRLSAQVLACVEPEDCQHAICHDSGHRNFGRRKRHSTLSENTTKPWHHGRIENFTSSFELKISMDGFTSTPIAGSTVRDDSQVTSHSHLKFSSCRNIIIAISATACILCLCTTVAAAIAIAAKRKKVIDNPTPGKNLNFQKTNHDRKKTIS